VRQQWQDTEITGWINLLGYLLATFGNLGNAHLPNTVAPAGGSGHGQITILPGTRATSATDSSKSTPVLLATLNQHFATRKPTALRPSFHPHGLALLAKATHPLTFRATFSYTPSGGKQVTSTFTFTTTPVPATQATASPPATQAAEISSVTIGGSPSNPSFVVRGKNLGTKPQPSPSGHPSGQNGCPVISGDSGYDYGTSLYIAVPGHNWSGGRFTGSETDCIDLVVTKFTPTEVDFHFGPFYTQNASKFPLNPGDTVQITVNNATTTKNR
jgi:hypothetical protein